MQKYDNIYTVTGGTGYIGSKALEELSKSNNLVYAIVRENSRKKIIKDNIIYVVFDGTEESIKLPISESGYLVHLAASCDMGTDEKSVSNLINSNIGFSTLLFNTANKFNKDIVISCASTFSNLDKDGNYEPITLYAATKKAVEDIACHYKDLSIHFLSIPDNYGPNDWRPKVHNLILRNTEWPFEFRSPEKQPIRIMHVNDVIGHFIKSFDNNNKGVHFHDIYSEGILLTLKEFSKIITDKECTFNNEENIIEIPLEARDISKKTGYINKYKNVDFSAIKLNK